MARRLAEPYVAWDDGLEDLVVKEAADLLDHLVGQGRAAVEHREHHALDHEVRIEGAADEVDCF